MKIKFFMFLQLYRHFLQICSNLNISVYNSCCNRKGDIQFLNESLTNAVFFYIEFTHLAGGMIREIKRPSDFCGAIYFVLCSLSYLHASRLQRVHFQNLFCCKTIYHNSHMTLTHIFPLTCSR